MDIADNWVAWMTETQMRQDSEVSRGVHSSGREFIKVLADGRTYPVAPLEETLET